MNPKYVNGKETRGIVWSYLRAKLTWSNAVLRRPARHQHHEFQANCCVKIWISGLRLACEKKEKKYWLD